MAQKKLSYTNALQELQSIVTELQSDRVDMEVLSNKVARAAELLEFCKTKLRDTEQKIEGLF